MANPEHLEALKKGATFWNEWRKQNDIRRPDLSNADLSNIRFAETNFDQVDGDYWEVDLKKINLRNGNFEGANLVNVDLRSSELEESNMRCADLRGAKLSYLRMSNVDLNKSNLTEADLSYTSLRACSFDGANLKNAHLTLARMTGVSLDRADLREAQVYSTFFIDSHFKDTDLRSSLLSGTRFESCSLDHVDFTDSLFSFTRLVDINLSTCIGLESAHFLGPSFIGIETLYNSQGRIPDIFLRNAGVSEDIIQNLMPLIRGGDPIQFRSCFISYSTKDNEFAHHLHARMRQENMRVWFAPEDLKGGEKLHEQLFKAIQMHDRLLLVLSESSIQSEWVMTEIRKAREVEKKEKRRKLFPIRLTEHQTLRDWTCFDGDTGKDLAVEVREYYIPDFSNWKDHDSFEREFAKLKRDLKAAATPPRSSPT